MKNNLSFTSGLLLVIMCAILCAGLCFSIVLFEDQIDVASAFSYSDVTWSNAYSISSSTAQVSLSSYGFNCFYVCAKNLSYSNSTLCTIQYYDSLGTRRIFNINCYSNNLYFGGPNSSSGVLLLDSSNVNSPIVVIPSGVTHMQWYNISSHNYVDIFLGTVSSGSIDPDEYVSIEEFEQLQSDYDALLDDLDELQDSYDTLSSDYLELQSNYQSVLDMNSDYETNLQQKRAELNIMYNNLSMLVMWINGVFIGNDESGTSQYTPEFEEYLEDLGYDLDNFLYTDFNDVVYDLRPIVRDMRTKYDYYQQFYDDYQELLEQHVELQGQYDSLVDSLSFTSKGILSIDKIDTYPGTTAAVSNGYIMAGNTTGEAKIRYNLGVTITANSDILIEYDFITNLYGGIQYPITVYDGHYNIIVVDSADDVEPYSYTPNYDVSYFIISAENPDSTSASIFLADMSVKARSFDLSVVIANAFEEGKNSVDTQSYTEAGFTEGYGKGYSDAGKGGIFLGLMTSVVDAPVQVVNGMFDFNLLGINVKQLFYSLISIALVIAIIKFLMK